MKTAKPKEKIVQSFLQLEMMKFRPQKVIAPSGGAQKSSKIISTMWPLKSKISSQIQQEAKEKLSLKYYFQINQGMFLIGNESQLDLINLHVIKKNIDVQFLWHVQCGKYMEHVAVDKGIIGIVSGLELIVYRYDIKKISSPPILLKIVPLKNEVKFLRFPKQSLLACFYDKYVQIYLVSQDNIRIKFDNPLKIKDNWQLVYVAHSFENIAINLFFQQKTEATNRAVHCIQINFTISQIKMMPEYKLYDIPARLLDSITIENYNRQIFLMSVEEGLTAVKKDYVLDSANVNLTIQNSMLKYIAPDRLLLISNKKIEVYHFFIDQKSVPPRIVINSLDAIKIQKPPNAQYLNIFQSTAGSWVLLYQIVNTQNKRDKEITYWITSTVPVKVQEKLNLLFPKQDMKKLMKDDTLLQDRCDMATKMGYSNKQLFLELWNRTNRKSDKDYAFLLATKDYETVRRQIERKLKKRSMTLGDVIKIEKYCFKMLQDVVFSPKCTLLALMNYLACHFFLRKLTLFQLIQTYKLSIMPKQKQQQAQRMEEQSPRKPEKQQKGQQEQDEQKVQKKGMRISIQQYTVFESLSIENFILQMIAGYLDEDKVINLTIARMTLTHFRFVFRTCYEKFLEKIIENFQLKLIPLLQAIPQLLPFDYDGLNSSTVIDEDIYKGVWPDITIEQKNSSLYLDTVRKLDNKYVQAELESGSGHVQFVRTNLIKHDYVRKSYQQIEEIHEKNKSQHIFYYFIAKVIEIGKNKLDLKQMADFLEKKYRKMPKNMLNGKIFLYKELYFNFFMDRNLLSENVNSLTEFLKLSYPQLFAYFFKSQRNQKGVLLKIVKEIFERTLQTENGVMQFNQGLYQYFKSDLSEVSDLKYILNRINNEKIEFHKQNQTMYNVLIDAMFLKLKVGTDNDIPIKEVLIYIQNIPISKQNDEVCKKLDFISTVEQRSQYFQTIRLNMSLKQIMECSETLIQKCVYYEIQHKKIMKIQDYKEFQEQTFKILAFIDLMKEELYQSKDSELPFSYYICKLLEDISKVEFVKKLIQNQDLISNYQIDEELIEKIVNYMYQWKLQEDRVYKNNPNYIKTLLTLLPPENQLRKNLLESNLEFALMMSVQSNLTHPIVDEGKPLSLTQIEQIFASWNKVQSLLNVDVQKLSEIMHNMQQYYYLNGQIYGEPTLTVQKMIAPYQIQQARIMRMLEMKNKLKDAAPLLYQIIDMDINEKCKIIYPIIFMNKFITKINDDCQKELLRCLCYYFNDPKKLMSIIKRLLQIPQSQSKRYLKKQADEGSLKNCGYKPNNEIFSKKIVALIQSTTKGFNLMKNIEQAHSKICESKQQFLTNPLYGLLMRILCNQPLMLAKFLFLNRMQINWKSIRSFLSYVILQDIFDPVSLMQISKRVFLIMLESNCQKIPVENLILNYLKKDINEDVELDIEKFHIDQEDEFNQKIIKSFKAFERKKNILRTDEKKKELQLKSQKQDYLNIEKHAPSEKSKEPSEYPFEDSDDGGDVSFIKEDIRKKTKRKVSTKMQLSSMIKSRGMKGLGQTIGIGGLTDPQALGTRSLRLPTTGNQAFLSSQKLTNTQKRQQPKNQFQQLDLQESQVMNLSESNRKIQKINTTPAKNKQITQQQNETQQAAISFKGKALASQKELQSFRSPKPQQIKPISENVQIKKTGSDVFIDYQAQVNEQEVQKLKKLIYKQNSVFLKNDGISTTVISYNALTQAKKKAEFIPLAKATLQSLYIGNQTKLSCLLKFIEEVGKKFPQLGINNQYVQIYRKLEDFHFRHKLDLPIKQAFPIDGLYSTGQTAQQLYNAIKPWIIAMLDEINVYKIIKIINMSFKSEKSDKNDELTQDIMFSYLKKFIKKEYTSSIIENEDEKKMAQEKIKVLAGKIKADFRKSRLHQLEQVVDQSLREELMAIIQEDK